jgi:hypothetical protein
MRKLIAIALVLLSCSAMSCEKTGRQKQEQRKPVDEIQKVDNDKINTKPIYTLEDSIASARRWCLAMSVKPCGLSCYLATDEKNHCQVGEEKGDGRWIHDLVCSSDGCSHHGKWEF